MSETICRLYENAVATGDESAWSELFRAGQPRLIHRLRALVGRRGSRVSGAEVEELGQEVWFRLASVSGEARFRGSTDAEFWAWVQRIARRLVVDAERRRRAAKRSAEVEVDAELDAEWRDSVPDPGADPESRLLLRERARSVEAVVREEAPPSRGDLVVRMLRLALVEGRSSREVADRLPGSLPARQIDLLLHRLRRRLEPRGIFLPHRAALSAL